MITSEQILKEWEVDSKIARDKLDHHNNDIPRLHHKYIKFWSEIKKEVNKLVLAEKQLQRILLQYYRGELNNPKDLEQIHRSPWQTIIAKQDIPLYVESDKQMVKLVATKQDAEDLLYIVVEILKSLSKREYVIKNSLEWLKLTSFDVNG